MSAAHARKEPRTTAKRVVYRVQWSPKTKTWRVTGNGAGESFIRKKDAVNVGVVRANWTYSCGIRTQLVIHNKDGRIESERTYGADPVRRKG